MLKMANLNQSPESKTIETSAESSVGTLDGLDVDCLLTILQHLPLLDCLRLRFQCRSLNDAVCEFLRSCRKLELNLGADRSGDDLQRVIDHYNQLQRTYYHVTLNIEDDIPEIRSITSSDTIKLHSHLFKNEPHFRSADMIQVRSAEGLTDRKVDSLVAFLAAHMPHLSELALLVSHEDYFRSVARLLSPLRKLKVFFIDANSSMKLDYGRSIHPWTEMVEAICGLPELESLYYFRNFWCEYIFCYTSEDLKALKDHHNQTMILPKVDPHRLGSGENFVEVLLPRLRVLHCHHFAFPVGMTFDKIEEISMRWDMKDSVTKNYFPGVKTLFIDDLYSQLGDGRLSFVNVRVLKLENYYSNLSLSDFYITSETMRALNDLPNLEELHCYYVSCSLYKIQNDMVVERNDTIARLYSQCLPDKCDYCQHGYHPDPANCIDATKRNNDYVSLCKKYFRGLQLFTNEDPPIVRHFRPETNDYILPQQLSSSQH